MPARIRRSVLVFAGLVFVAVSALVQAQIHGVPASVTSLGFGGSHSSTPGVAASVTSLGPSGFGGGHAWFGNCCTNPYFRTGGDSHIFMHGHHGHRNFFAGSVPVYGVPYALPYTQVVVVQPDAADDDEDYDGGPTIFDRRGSYPGRSRVVRVDPEPTPAAHPPIASEPPAPVVAQPSTVLVFRDGHEAELQNYAIVGDTIFDLTEHRAHKILLADLDLPATRKANDERGVEFQLPGNPAR